ncbi:MAG: hypothetical protein RL215_3076, partial [Planctomycetota bacterium]
VVPEFGVAGVEEAVVEGVGEFAGANGAEFLQFAAVAELFKEFELGVDVEIDSWE